MGRIGKAGTCWVWLILLAMPCCSPGCRRVARPVAPPAEVEPGKPSPATDAGTPVEADSSPPAAATGGAEQAPRARTHPDALGKDYGLLAMGEVATSAQEEEFFRQMTNAKSAERAFQDIKKEGARWLPFLHRALRSTNREVRIQAAVMLGLLKDRTPGTIEAMRDALILDRDPDVRAMVARSFLAIPAQRAVDLLVRILEADPYEAARANAAWALGESGDRKAVPVLIRALQDEDTFVRLRAVSALLKFQAREAVPALVGCLSDKSPMVRERAHMALKKITGKSLPADESTWRKALGIGR